MPNPQRPRLAAPTLFPGSSTAVLDNLYSGRESGVRSERVSTALSQRAPAPDAIWGQFNNYRSNGLAGSAVVHIIALGLILSAATFGHQVVRRPDQELPNGRALAIVRKGLA